MVITFEDVNIVRRRKDVIQDLSAEIREPLTVLMGINGAGKSTLLQAIVGLLRYSGAITVEGIPMNSAHHKEAARLIGYAPQTIRWPRRMTALEVCELAARLRGLRAVAARAAAAEALARVGGDAVFDRAMGSLSGGEHRRVTVAQALVHTPRVLVLDEPTSELDPLFAEDFALYLRELAQDHMVIATTHSVDDAVSWGGALGVVADGQIRWAAPQAASSVDDVRTPASVRDFLREVTHA